MTQDEEDRRLLASGRELFCPECSNFTKAAVGTDGEEKVIICRRCGNESARLVPRGDGMWLLKELEQSPVLMFSMVLGDSFVVKSIDPERGKVAEEPRSKRRPRKSVRVRPHYRKETDLSIGKTDRKRLIPLAVAILGVFHLLLTFLAVQWRFFFWPFTYAWDAFAWMPLTAQFGLAVAAVIGGGNVYAWILLRRREKSGS